MSVEVVSSSKRTKGQEHQRPDLLQSDNAFRGRPDNVQHGGILPHHAVHGQRPPNQQGGQHNARKKIAHSR